MFILSACTFGGGYVIVPLMRKKFSEQLKLISEKEIFDLVALGQTAPGAIAVNSAVLVGFKVLGVPGALVSGLSITLPPLILISVIFMFYSAMRDHPVARAIMMGMGAGVAAIILDAAYCFVKQIIKNKDLALILIIPAALALTLIFKVNIAILLLGGALIGLLNGFIRGRTR
jgi:chromate transporter